ncbi:DUF4240 domain-containing protein [Blastococcus sp. LR1]|uniref:DUF4240 domain-containing protein n=1 Tax=Blastococcus sp. LR1 TaxID=2877000 RepID=UPI001CCF2AFE|nr:DUF4240 domain-containing protein [Blastococcus sp. LR1]MCA0146484.1 DUF4240 domain-containing protein [Blastococcus sp. LR1]
MRLFRRPLAEDDFWGLIAVAEGRTDEAAIGRLTDALSARRAKDVVAFQERLARVLFELDREVLADQPVRFGDDPPDEEPIPLSDDGFLYLRAGIVLAGRETYDRVLRDPAVLAQGEWDECEDLLYVAEEVLGDDIDTKVSYETASNLQHWTPRAEPEREPWDQGLRSVSVDAHDMADPIEAERPTADGGWEPEIMYVAPRFLGSSLLYDVSTDLARIVTTNGGLPGELAAGHVVAVVELGESWRLEPQVGEPTRSELGDHRELTVRVAVPTATVRGWTTGERRTGFASLAAACLLAVLPTTHAAVPGLERLRAAGEGLLAGG